MGTYGRNFEFRVPPDGGARAGRYSVPTGGAVIPIGAPIVVTPGAAATALGMAPVTLATGASAPVSGISGILVYEYGPAAFAGNDAMLTTYSDKDTAPLGAAVQLVNDPEVKVVFKNTVASTFLVNRAYAGRIMVAGMGATPTIAVGDYLTPGTGNDTAGYWAETATASNAWLVVTGVDVTRSEVEARFVY